MLMSNPVVLSVVAMCVLCLLKLNVLIALIVSAVIAGLAAGMPLYVPGAENNIIDVLINGMGGNSATALSYILLGAFAVGLARSGLGTILSTKIANVLKGRKYYFIFAIAFISCFSQNLVPVHIAFIPILIPPLLSLMNKMKIDRRAVACALTFGLKAPYVVLPMGFGLIFHDLIVSNINQYGEALGIKVTITNTASVMWIGGLSMLVGLIFCVLVLYRRPREYQDLPIIGSEFYTEISVLLVLFLHRTLATAVGNDTMSD